MTGQCRADDITLIVEDDGSEPIPIADFGLERVDNEFDIPVAEHQRCSFSCTVEMTKEEYDRLKELCD